MKATANETRTSRRKAETREALLWAATSYIAEGNESASVSEIAARADVGLGTLYNHFATKDGLLNSAVEHALKAYGDLLDLIISDDQDPVLVFTQRFRYMGRMHRIEPEMSRALLSRGVILANSDPEFTGRARRDLARAIEVGRFDPWDLEVATAVVVATALAIGQALHDDPKRDVGQTVDDAAKALLVMLGVQPAEALELSRGDLPGI